MEETPKPPSLAGAVSSGKAVVFDLFHTLVSLQREPGRERPELHEILGVTRQDFTDALRLTAHSRLVGTQTDAFLIVSEIAHAINKSIPEAAIRRTADRIVEVFSATLEGIPGRVVSILGLLRRSGKKLGLASNASAMEITGWSRSPIAPLFTSVVFSCFCGSVKPEEKIYRICIDGLDVSPEGCLFVGDGESNELEGARSLGMTTVMTTEFIGGMRPDIVDQRRRSADFVITRLDELVEGF